MFVNHKILIFFVLWNKLNSFFYPFLLPKLESFIISLNKNCKVNLYFQDESRFGLKTETGRCLTACGVRPIVKYQHKFSNTYLYGSYSPIDGDSFTWEINGVDNVIFEEYLRAFSLHRPEEHKIVVIDNAGFHSTKNINIPENIHLLRIPPYTPELNPCEKIWHYIKSRYKNQLFENMDQLKDWLHNQVVLLGVDRVKSITHNHHYLEAFYAAI